MRGLDEPNSIYFIFFIFSYFTCIYLDLLSRRLDKELDRYVLFAYYSFEVSSIKSIGASFIDSFALRKAIGIGFVIIIF